MTIINILNNYTGNRKFINSRASYNNLDKVDTRQIHAISLLVHRICYIECILKSAYISLVIFIGKNSFIINRERRFSPSGSFHEITLFVITGKTSNPCH